MWHRVQLLHEIHNLLYLVRGAVDAERAGGSTAAIAACIPASRLAGSVEDVVGVVVVPGPSNVVLTAVADVGAAELGTVKISRQI